MATPSEKKIAGDISDPDSVIITDHYPAILNRNLPERETEVINNNGQKDKCKILEINMNNYALQILEMIDSRI